MTIVEGQIEPLKKLKEILVKKGIKDLILSVVSISF